MSKHKKNTIPTEKHLNPPETLDEHIFFGIVPDEEQRHFRQCIWSDDYDVIFCDAMAGTGKTLISVATAMLLKKYKQYDGIVYIVSPTQEERLGYLPGDPDQKVAPYMAPIMKALTKLGEDPTRLINQIDIQNLKEGTSYIDCVPHTYLRGDNFENKIIIIDEAQNVYLDDLRKVLTRPVDNCKVIVIGHVGQCDLYKNPVRSGFNFYKEWYRNMPRAVVCELHTNHRGWISTHADKLDVVALCEYLDKNRNKSIKDIDLKDFEIK